MIVLMMEKDTRGRWNKAGAEWLKGYYGADRLFAGLTVSGTELSAVMPRAAWDDWRDLLNQPCAPPYGGTMILRRLKHDPAACALIMDALSDGQSRNHADLAELTGGDPAEALDVLRRRGLVHFGERPGRDLIGRQEYQISARGIKAWSGARGKQPKRREWTIAFEWRIEADGLVHATTKLQAEGTEVETYGNITPAELAGILGAPNIVGAGKLQWSVEARSGGPERMANRSLGRLAE